MRFLKNGLLSIITATALLSVNINAKEVDDKATNMVEKYGDASELKTDIFISSEDQANEYLTMMGEKHPKLDDLSTGWNDTLNAYIAIGTAGFKVTNPKADKSFIIKRDLKAMSAMLYAKSEIIEFISQEMDAQDKVDVPNTDLEAKFGERKRALEEQYENVVTKINKYKKYLDEREADYLEGVTFKDYASAGFRALVKKLDSSLDKEKLASEEKKEYEQMKTTYDKTSSEAADLKKQIAAASNVAETLKSKVQTMAQMPLFGATAIAQFESWDKTESMYETSIVMIWSKKMERASRALITGEDYSVKSRQTKSISKWIKQQDWSTSTGVRKFTDKDGVTHFIGISAMPLKGSSSVAKRKAKGAAEQFAKKNAAVSVFADVGAVKTAEAMMETYSDGEEYEESAAMADYGEKLTQTLQKRKVSGLSKRFGKVLKHPISGQKMYVSIYSVDQKSAKKALWMQERNYLTKVLDTISQKKLKKKEEDLKQAVKEAEELDLTQTTQAPQRTKNYETKQVKEKTVQKAPKESKSYAGAGASEDFDW